MLLYGYKIKIAPLGLIVVYYYENLAISLFHSPSLRILIDELIEWLWRHFYRTHLHISTQCVYWMSLRCVIQNASWMSILDSLFGAFMCERMGIEVILRNHVSHGLGLAIYHFVLHFRGIFILMHSWIFVLTDKCLFIFEMNISISSNPVLHSIPLAIPDRLFIHSYASYARRFFSNFSSTRNLCSFWCAFAAKTFPKLISTGLIEPNCVRISSISVCLQWNWILSSVWALHFVFACVFFGFSVPSLMHTVIIRWANIIGKFATSLDSSYSVAIWYINGILFVIHHFSLYNKKKSLKHTHKRTHAR